MTGPLFADTNLLVYARDASDAPKQERAAEWVEFLWETRRGRLSRQVLHEYYVTVTRKLRPGLSVAEARADVRALFHWLAPIDPAVLIEAAWLLQDRCSLSFWDALVVGAAQTLGCRAFLTEDLPAGQDLEGVLVVNPFQVRPAELDR
jgi:predicted nucleic acid-binding protein